ncbi:hypothetical protein PoB_006619800 [Plakobranchus ocellatus]|uniref:Uncharacterized protein n=1 Tax=Plakobranchus ocellatus TaxID=259542 RepID=A0AAV4D6B5_9GAST|nr:hypothetical protein PoB_006619800 [Plakobranchus ocellatus]
MVSSYKACTAVTCVFCLTVCIVDSCQIGPDKPCKFGKKNYKSGFVTLVPGKDDRRCGVYFCNRMEFEFVRNDFFFEGQCCISIVRAKVNDKAKYWCKPSEEVIDG